MRIVAAASFALALTFVSPALAQQATPAPECAAFTPVPTVPDGSTASNSAMRDARVALEAWRATRRSELAACETASRALEARARAGMTAHNAAGAEVDEVIARFTAENEEYSARGGQSRRERSSPSRPNGR